MKKNVYLLVFLLSSSFLLNGQITLSKQEYDNMQKESTDCKKNVAQLKKELTFLDKADSSKKLKDLKKEIRKKKKKIKDLEEVVFQLKAAPSCDQLKEQISIIKVWLKDTKDAVKKLSASSKEDKKQIQSQEKEIAELQQEASRSSKKDVKFEDLNKCKTELHYLKEKGTRYKNKLSQQEDIIDSLILLTRGAFIPGYTDRTKVKNIINTAESLLQKEYNLRTVAFSIAELKKVDNTAFTSQVNRLLPLLQNYCAKHIKTYDALHDIDKVRSITYRNQDIQTVLESIVDYPYLTERVQLKVENIDTKGSFLSKINACN